MSLTLPKFSYQEYSQKVDHENDTFIITYTFDNVAFEEDNIPVQFHPQNFYTR